MVLNMAALVIMCYNDTLCGACHQGRCVMKKLSIREARQSLSHLDRLLEEQGEITITRRGKPIGRVTAIGGKKAIPSHKELRMKMRRVKTESRTLVREDREGR